jgi:hypothetical protein
MRSAKQYLKAGFDEAVAKACAAFMDDHDDEIEQIAERAALKAQSYFAAIGMTDRLETDTEMLQERLIPLAVAFAFTSPTGVGLFTHDYRVMAVRSKNGQMTIMVSLELEETLLAIKDETPAKPESDQGPAAGAGDLDIGDLTS